MSPNRPIRVGIVGAHAERGWAFDAHIPALRAMPDRFALAAVSGRTREQAERARDAFGAGTAFDDSLALVRDPGVDLVAVAVKVPEHRAVVLAALAAGKAVYCEWPLGRNLAEAAEMAAAVPDGVRAAVGLQGPCAPAIRHAAALVREGAIGRPLTLRVVSPTAGWGDETLPTYRYLEDPRNGATFEAIAGGHTLSAIEAVVGPFDEADARASVRRPRVRVHGTGEVIERVCPDHLLVLGRHAGGCVSSLEVVGGAWDIPFRFELEGERGRLSVTGGHPGGYGAGVLTVHAAPGLPPQPPPAAPGLEGPPANVAELYARLADDLGTGGRTAPDFRAALRLTRLLDAIRAASDTGIRARGLAAAA